MSESGNETGFTPGPWKAGKDRDQLGAHHVQAESGFLVARVHGAVRSEGPYGPYFPIESETTDANARVIAAAPTLHSTETKLCNEVSGVLEQYEEGLRQLIGNTNYNVLKLRCDEAKAALLLSNTGGTGNG